MNRYPILPKEREKDTTQLLRGMQQGIQYFGAEEVKNRLGNSLDIV